MPTAELSTARLHYELIGEGPPLLIINGTGSDLRRRPNVLDGPAVEEFTVLTYEHRGLGRSRAHDVDAQPAMDDFGADALELADHLGWDRFALLGISFGGMVAQHTAGRAGNRITRLVLACTSAGGSGGASAPLHEVYAQPGPERVRRMVALSDLRTHTDAARRDAMVAFSLGMLAKEDPETLPGVTRQLEARRHHDTWDDLPALTTPTLVAGGRHDGIAPLANLEALAGRIPGAQMRVFEGGHAFFLDDPAAWPAMLAFLRP